VLKVLGEHQLLTLAILRQTTPREATQEPKGSLSHAKKLLKRLRQTGRNSDCLFCHRLRTGAKQAPSGIQRTM